MKKAVILQTLNTQKHLEYVNIFKRYDIEVIMSSQKTLIKHQVNPLEFISEEYDVIAILADESNLYNLDGSLSFRKDFDIVENKTTLYYLLKDASFVETLSDKMDGWIDISQKNSEAFSWDDIFIVKSTGLSYYNLAKRGLKISPRNRLVSEFIKKTLYYKESLNLNFNKQDQERSIIFDTRVIDFIETNKYLSLPLVQKHFGPIFHQAMNMGAFFRSAKNRREKNYWLPGLNAGLPLVGKKDEIHEITFAVHDLCHFAMPDLIFDIDNRVYKNTYVLHRMMSEAITMVYADMLFIDCLVQSGIDYDFTKRKIYPLYSAIMKNNPDVKLKDILYANVQYCLFGDESFYLSLLQDEDISIFKDFKEKFEPFFVEDYKWTDHNFNAMYLNKDLFKKWSSDFKNVFAQQKLLTISSLFHSSVYNKDSKIFADNIFYYIISNYFGLKVEKPRVYMKNGIVFSEVKDDKALYISNSFKNYMLGQVFIFYKFSFLSVSKPYLDKIIKILEQDIISFEEMNKVRAFYENFLSLLKDELYLIDEDDFETYKEVFPIFDSFYVFYDKDKNYYKDLKEISKEILN